MKFFKKTVFVCIFSDIVKKHIHCVSLIYVNHTSVQGIRKVKGAKSIIERGMHERGVAAAAARAGGRISFVKITRSGNAGIPDLSNMHFRQQPKRLSLF